MRCGVPCACRSTVLCRERRAGAELQCHERLGLNGGPDAQSVAAVPLKAVATTALAGPSALCVQVAQTLAEKAQPLLQPRGQAARKRHRVSNIKSTPIFPSRGTNQGCTESARRELCQRHHPVVCLPTVTMMRALRAATAMAGARSVVRAAPVRVAAHTRRHMSAGVLTVDNPYTGETAAEVQLSTADEALAKLGVAADVQRSWARVPLEDRLDLCERFIDAMTANSEAVAQSITAQMGKPLAHARGEINGMAERARGGYCVLSCVVQLAAAVVCRVCSLAFCRCGRGQA